MREDMLNSQLTLIGALIDPDTRREYKDLIISKLPNGCFGDGAIRSLFVAAKTVYCKHEELDVASVMNELKAVDNAYDDERTKYAELIIYSVELNVSDVTIPDHIKRVYGEYRVNILSKQLEEINQTIQFSGNPEQVLSLFRKAAETQEKLDEVDTCSTSMDMTDSIIEYLQYLCNKQSDAFKTGNYKLDYILGGIHPQMVYVLSGRSGSGKSDLAIYLATALAAKDARVLYLSMEMPRTQIIERVASRLTEINSMKLRDKDITEEEQKSVTLALDRILELPLTLDEQQNLSVEDVLAKMRQHRPDIIFIDHIGLMKQTRGEKHWESIDKTAKRLKQIAMKHKIAIVLLVQQNREIENRKTKVSNLSDLKGSDSIGNHSDAVMFITPEKPNHFLSGNEFVTAKLEIPKNRGGSTGTMTFHWYPQYHRYFVQEDR